MTNNTDLFTRHAAQIIEGDNHRSRRGDFGFVVSCATLSRGDVASPAVYFTVDGRGYSGEVFALELTFITPDVAAKLSIEEGVLFAPGSGLSAMQWFAADDGRLEELQEVAKIVQRYGDPTKSPHPIRVVAHEGTRRDFSGVFPRDLGKV